jgi:hypothetical protein
MPDTLMTEPCSHCGGARAHTTLLWPDPDAARQIEGVIHGEILIERPGLWCATCDDGAPDALELVPAPRRRAA